MHILSVILLVASVVSLFVAANAFKNKNYIGNIYLAFLMLAGSFYSFGYSFELASTNISDVLFWGKIQYIGIFTIPVFWLYFAISFCRRIKWVTLPVKILTILIPFCFYIIYLTNPLHNKFYEHISLKTINEITIIQIVPGPFYYAHITISYLSLFIGSALFVNLLRKSEKKARTQSIILVAGCLVTWTADIVYIIGLSPYGIDLGPIALIITGFIFLYAMLRFHMIEVTLAFKTIFTNIRDAIIVIDNDLQIVQINPSAKKLLLDISSNEKIIPDLHKYPDLAQIITNSQNESTFFYKNNEIENFFQVTISEVHKGKQLIGKILTLTNITSQKQNEQKLLKSEGALRHLNLTKSRFFSIISHDLRGPVGNINALLQFARDNMEINNPELSEFINTTSITAKTTYDLLNNLLSWSRLQLDEIIFMPARYSIREISDAAIDPLKGMAERKSIKLVNLIADNYFGYFDFDMISAVFRNLANNAIKFTYPEGVVIFKAIELEFFIEISVIDSGIGIDEKLVSKLFKIEEKISSSPGTNDEKGSGFGLILCKEFVEKNGGKISVNTKCGEGSTFIFTIPKFIPSQ